MKEKKSLTRKERYLENHIETIKEYFEEGMKYLKSAQKQIKTIEKINRSKL